MANQINNRHSLNESYFLNIAAQNVNKLFTLRTEHHLSCFLHYPLHALSLYPSVAHFLFRAKHAETELTKKKNELKKTEKEYNKDKVLYDDIQKNTKKLEVM